MNKETVYDIIGVGIGPFNLGLAALAHGIPKINVRFIEQRPCFSWHPGLLLKNSRLQVPFYADLVTMADPRSLFSYLNFLHDKQRLFRFAISEHNFLTRIEYNQYCQWTAEQLPSLRFGLRCEAIHFDEVKKIYTVYAVTHDGYTVRFHGKRVVIGVGTVPSIPECAEDQNHPLVFHSSGYLFKKAELLKSKNITVVGSGQSAAEIFYDLMQHAENFESLTWYTRSDRPFPMDYSKFALEMTSPDYIDYFYRLPKLKKQHVLSMQENLYKGINTELIREIWNQIYLNEINKERVKIKIRPNQSLENIDIRDDQRLQLSFRHTKTELTSTKISEACILATGYKNVIPGFLEPIKNKIGWEGGNYRVNRNYSVDDNNSIFVQNADLHTHGFNSADLGMGPYRNAIILNSILGYDHFKMESHIAFQQFEL